MLFYLEIILDIDKSEKFKDNLNENNVNDLFNNFKK